MCAAGLLRPSYPGPGSKKFTVWKGGYKAWKGFVAKGVPEAGMAYFLPAAKPEELMALAWLLEDGSPKVLYGNECKRAGRSLRQKPSTEGLYGRGGKTPGIPFPDIPGDNRAEG